VASIFERGDLRAAVLRPYKIAMTDGLAVKLTAEILRFAQDDNAFFD
jgi:hypothetical protein